jgi:lipoyl(octanoyl) transferase
MNVVFFEDLGFIDYQEAWDYQQGIFDGILSLKSSHRKSGLSGLAPSAHRMLFCQHPHTYTLGKSGKLEHLLINQQVLEDLGAKFFPINRGGDITYHGPGQLVGYPILDLEHFSTDIHLYLRNLEEAIILTLDHYGIKAGRSNGETGVWIDPNTSASRKICAMGIRASRWVTMHGFAFNVNTDLQFFDYIVPCGIQDKSVTSMHRELNRVLDFSEVADLVKQNLAKVFDYQYA